MIDLGSVLLQAVEVSRPLLTEKQQRLSLNSAAARPGRRRLGPPRPGLRQPAQQRREVLGARRRDRDRRSRSRVARRSSRCVTRGWEWRPSCWSAPSTSSCRTCARSTAPRAASASGSRWCGSLVKLHGGTVRALQRRPRPRLRDRRPPPRSRARARPRRAARPVAARDAAPGARDTPAAHPGGRRQRRRRFDARPSARASRSRGRGRPRRSGRARDTRGTRTELVFIDIGLPGMDGYALATALRAAGFEDATLVAVTGYGRDDDLQRSRDEASTTTSSSRSTSRRSSASPPPTGAPRARNREL